MQLTIKQILKPAAAKLNNNLEAEVLLSHVLQKPRSFLYSHADEILSEQQQNHYQLLLKRAMTGEPIAYIIGYKEFYGRDFIVSPAVLIPRPDTETLINTTLDLLPATEKLQVLDLGAGSGAICITLALECPNWQITAVDNCAAALKVAQSNAAKHQVKNLQLINSNWFSSLDKNFKFDAIVANPPYIAMADKHLKDLTSEPKAALVAGEDGLDDIKIIINQAVDFLRPLAPLIIEHGFQQAQQASLLLQQQGFINIKTIKDFGGNDRVTLGFKINNER